MVQKYYRVDVDKGIPGKRQRFAVTTVNYFATSKKNAINKAKREGFRQSVPKKYKLYYSAILLD